MLGLVYRYYMNGLITVRNAADFPTGLPTGRSQQVGHLEMCDLFLACLLALLAFGS